MEKMIKMLNSEKGMNVVNIVFLLSVFIRSRGIHFIAYLSWIVYLLYCVKHSQSKITKHVYRLFMAFAMVMILLNMYSLFMYSLLK